MNNLIEANLELTFKDQSTNRGFAITPIVKRNRLPSPYNQKWTSEVYQLKKTAIRKIFFKSG